MSKFFIDGAPLDDPGGRWVVERSTVLPSVGARDVATLRLPGSSRVITKRLGWAEGAFHVSVAVLPAGWKDGVLPGESAETRVRLVSALLARATTLKIVDGTVAREVGVISAQVSEPSRVGVDAWQVEAQLTVQPFWSAGSVITAPAATIPGVALFSGWAGSTGDVQDGLLRVKGPATRVAVVAADGTGVSFEKALTRTQYAFIRPSTFEGWVGAAADWNPTSTRLVLDYPPAGPLILSPGDAGVQVTVSGDGMTSESAAVLRGKRWWL